MAFALMGTNLVRGSRSDSLPSIHPLPLDQEVICGARGVGVSGGVEVKSKY